MKAYKIMRAKHYKPGSVVETSNANYGKRTGRVGSSQALADAAIEVCSQSKVTFEQMVTVLRMLQSPAENFRLPLTMTTAQAEMLGRVARSAPPIIQGDFGATFWESLYEKVRIQDRPHCPSRQKSYFGSRDLGSLRRYRDEHWTNRMSDKVVCEIDVTGCPVAFEADMVILDKVAHDMTFESARPHVLRYWDQEMSSNPNVEVLFQGTVVLGQQVKL